jgi:uncharacterized membrane protein YhhN
MNPLPLVLFLPGVVWSAVRTVIADTRDDSAKRAFYKPLTTILILLSCVSSFAFGKPALPYTALIAVGLLFSLGGDIALLSPKEGPFMAGLILFLIAHCCYAAAFLTIAPFASGDLIGGLVVLGILIAVYAFLFKGLGKMRLPTAGYTLVIGFMLFRAIVCGRVLPWPVAVCVVAGAGLFFLSDIILAVDRFRIRIPKNGYYVLTTYYAGQMLLALSVFGRP